MKSGIELIAQERGSQLNKHKWTSEHDDEHCYGELAIMAATLCAHHTDATVHDPEESFGTGDDGWGLEVKLKGNNIHRLKVAGALIAAEIDRLLRAGEADDDKDE